jgi:hypothetical protein
MKPRLLISNPGQFGYKAGYYYYAKYLKESFQVTFICFDEGYPKVQLEGVEIEYVKDARFKLFRVFKWVYTNYLLVKHDQFDIVFAVYTKFISGLKLFSAPKTNYVVDFRTGSLRKNKLLRRIENLSFLLESYFFQNITVLSHSLAKKIGLHRNKYHYLPLGSKVFSERKKNYDQFSILYVGSFNQRRIWETIQGLHLFRNKNGDYLQKISYDIIGFGSKIEEIKLKTVVKEFELESIVKIHTRKNHDDLIPFFNKCNIGVAYVPITDYYDIQPSTKIFEYALSGLFSIATKTSENELFITSENGVLISDNPEGFSEALEFFILNGSKLSESEIRESLKSHNWGNIVQNNLLPYLQNIVK